MTPPSHVGHPLHGAQFFQAHHTRGLFRPSRGPSSFHTEDLSPTHSSIVTSNPKHPQITHSSIQTNRHFPKGQDPSSGIQCHKGYIGQHGIGLSGSYQQGYSTAYNTQLHIKVVCNGYILTHVLNCNSWGDPEALPPKGRSPSCTMRGNSLFVCM